MKSLEVWSRESEVRERNAESRMRNEIRREWFYLFVNPDVSPTVWKPDREGGKVAIL